jgi:hypothetical protein
MHDTLSGRGDELAAMGLDNLTLEGPLVYSREGGYCPNYDDARGVCRALVFAQEIQRRRLISAAPSGAARKKGARQPSSASRHNSTMPMPGR